MPANSFLLLVWRTRTVISSDGRCWPTRTSNRKTNKSNLVIRIIMHFMGNSDFIFQFSVWLLDHAWTFRASEGDLDLKKYEGLKQRYFFKKNTFNEN